MNDNIELLNFIYKNAKMGVIGINNIIENIKNKKLLKVIYEQRNDYYDICTKSIKLLSEYNSEKEDISKMAELMTYMDAKMKLMKDSSTSNIAQLMMEGNNKGIVEITQKIHKYREAYGNRYVFYL